MQHNVGLLVLLSACIGYAAPAGAFEKGKIVEVPRLDRRAMTPERQEQAKAYARQNGIRWRIVQGK